MNHCQTDGHRADRRGSSGSTPDVSNSDPSKVPVNVFVISLDRLPERAAFMHAGLTELGIRYELFSAVDAARGDHEAVSRYNEKESLRRFGAPLSPGEIGCFASHYLLWQRCVAVQEPMIILEDDVQVSPGFRDAVALVDKLIETHRFIRLAGYYDRAFRAIEDVGEGRRLVRFLRGPAGTQCYCVSPQGAAIFLEAATSWAEPVDQFIDRFWSHGVESKGLLPFEAREIDRSLLPQAIDQHRSFKRSGIAKLRREWRRCADQMARTLYNLTHP